MSWESARPVDRTERLVEAVGRAEREADREPHVGHRELGDGGMAVGPPAADAALRIERAVDKAYASGIKPMEYGGKDGTAAISNAIMKALG